MVVIIGIDTMESSIAQQAGNGYFLKILI